MAPIRLRTFTLSTVLKLAALALVLSLIAWYGFFQARSLIEGPRIALLYPIAQVGKDGSLYIRGYARNITELTLNGRTIFTDESGYFEELLVLPEGYTIMTLRAKDRYGRTTALSEALTFTPDNS